jgi:branched-chain amino acid transport system ATP-binding protein
MAVIVVEQHARIALSLTDHAIVLDRGRIVYRGESKHLSGDPDTLHRLLVGDPRPDPVEPGSAAASTT